MPLARCGMEQPAQIRGACRKMGPLGFWLKEYWSRDTKLE